MNGYLKSWLGKQAALTNDPEAKVCHTEELWIRNGVRVNPAKKYAKSNNWIFTQCLPLCALIEEPQIRKYGRHENQLSQKLWGMDRFRINALEKIIGSGQLSNGNQ